MAVKSENIEEKTLREVYLEADRAVVLGDRANHVKNILDGVPRDAKGTRRTKLQIAVVLACYLILMLAPLLAYGTRVFYTACEPTYLALCGAAGYSAVLIAGVSLPRSRKKRGNFAILKRWFCSLVPFIVALSVPIPDRSTDIGEGFILVTAAFVTSSALIAALAWLSQFPARRIFEDLSNPFQAKAAEYSAVWARNAASSGNALKIENRVDVAFTFFAALLLNGYVLFGDLSHPMLFVCFYIALIVGLLVWWLVRLEQWRSRTRAWGRPWSEMLPLVLVGLVSLVLLCFNICSSQAIGESAMDRFVSTGVIELENPRESFFASWNRQDLTIFAIQFAVVIGTTSLPYIASWLYKSAVHV